MENRYLFRAKRIDTGEWVEGFPFLVNDVSYILPHHNTGQPIHIDNLLSTSVEALEDTICQCTGLQDKNGNLIWENDIVKCVDENNDIEFTAIIEFGNPNGLYSWGYQLQHIKGDEPNLDILLWVDMEEAGATCKVIGNMIDNPELLEVQE